MKKIILVLGVYRSGTSALTKGLEVFGLPLVEISSTFLDEFNEKGYWEDLDFHGLNAGMLKSLDPLENRRRGILPITEGEVTFLCNHGFLEKASQLILEKLPASAPLGLKDPKSSLLLPFWKKVFQHLEIEASYVIALRNPFHAVASMIASQKILGKQYEEKSFWIWITYLLSCLEQTEGCKRLIVDYDQLIHHPAAQLHRIAAVCELSINQQLLQSYCSDFIDPALSHFEKEPTIGIAGHLEKTFSQEIYQKLLAVAKDEIDFQQLESSLPSWREKISSAHSLLLLAEKEEYTIDQCQKKIDDRDHSIFELNKTINKNLYSTAQLCQKIHQRDLQIASLVQELEKQKRDSSL